MKSTLLIAMLTISVSSFGQVSIQGPIAKECSLKAVQVGEMIIKKGFYDAEWNNKAGGGINDYQEFESGGGKVILDKSNGLMWQKSGSSMTKTYNEALNEIVKLNADNFAGYKDWRLPTIMEAMSLMEPAKHNEQHIDQKFDRTQRTIWTSEPCEKEHLWIVGFVDGLRSIARRNDNDDVYVRAVRLASGQTQFPIPDAGPNKTICAGSSVAIGGRPAASGGHGGPYAFRWTPTTGLNNPKAANPIATPTATTEYTLEVTDAAGANATDKTIVTVQQGNCFTHTVTEVGDGQTSIVTGDFDGDGDLDLAATKGNYFSAGFSNQLAILQNDGRGNYAVVSSPLVGGKPVSVTTGDFDGDRDLDLAVTHYSESFISVLFNSGKGDFATRTDYGTGNTWSDFPAAADVDRDGNLDLLVTGTHSGNVAIFNNKGNGTFQPKVDYHFTRDADDAAVADLDNDGDLDLAVTAWDAPGLTLFENAGDGRFTIKRNITVGLHPVGITAADLNTDGWKDLAVANYDANTVSILYNTRSWGFTQTSIPSGGSAPVAVIAADLNFDGHLDLAVTNEKSNIVSILQNDGNGSFAQTSSHRVGNKPRYLTTGDFDSDGDSDLAVANAGSNSVSILKNDGSRPLMAEAGYDKQICSGQSITVGGNPTATSGTPPYTYRWLPTTGLGNPAVANPKARPATTTTYAVEVTDAKGYKATDKVTVNVHQFVFLSEQLVKINQNQTSQGDIHSNGQIKFGPGALPGKHSGNLTTSTSNISIQDNNTIVGNVTAGGKIYLSGSATVTGSKTDRATISPITLTPISFSAGGTDVTVPTRGSQTLAPGSYNVVKVKQLATLFLSAGDYFFNSCDVDSSAILACRVSAGAVNVHVASGLSFDRAVKVRITGTGAATDKVMFITLQGAKVDIGMNAMIQGTLIAPNAEVHFSERCRFKGSVCAKTITLDAQVKFQFHSLGVLTKGADEEVEASEVAKSETVTSYELAQNYPNPFSQILRFAGNPSTTINFALPEALEVSLKIYDVAGQLVQTLVDGVVEGGRHQVAWDGTNQHGVPVASGVYFYQMRAGEFKQVRKMSLVR